MKLENFSPKTVVWIVFNVLIMAFALRMCWEAGKLTKDPEFYVLFGMALMLWPCQWAFWFGKRAAKLEKTP